MGMTGPSFLDDTRGVSSAVSYTLAIGITIVLVGGLVFTFGGLLDGNLDRTTDSELRVLSEGVATELTKVDNIANRTDDTGTYATLLQAPTDIAGQSYTITVGDETCQGLDGPCVLVETDDRSHHVPINSSHELTGSVDGGDFWIVVTGDTIELMEERPS